MVATLRERDDSRDIAPAAARPPEPRRRLEIAVLEGKEDDVLHAEDPRGFALFLCAGIAQTRARHVGIL